MKPLVSILIPAFNAARWIEDCLDSAFAQTHQRCEVIVVDDGSTDDTFAIIQRYAARHSDRLRVAHQPNCGAATARNHALKLATGEYIQFLDADDLLAPEKVANQISHLSQAAHRSVAAGPWGRFQDDPTTATFVPEDNWRDLPVTEWLRLNFAGRGMMPPAAWLIPRAVALDVGPWDETLTLNDDGEYFTRVLLASTQVEFCPGAQAYYRSGLPGSLSRSRSRRAWDSAYRSQLASAEALLAADPTPESRRACADLFTRLIFEMYPDCCDILEQCKEQVARFGGSSLRPSGGRLFQLTSRLFGWRLARRCQMLAGRRP